MLGADEGLAALLADVLADLGISVGGGGEPDLAIVAVSRAEPVESQVQRAAGRAATPVLLILPFEDAELAARAGTHAPCFALGSPLAELRRAVLAAARAPGSSRHG